MKSKKILVSISLVLALGLSVFAIADTSTSLKLGDTNGDGSISAADALEILHYSVGKIDKFSAENSTSSSPILNSDTTSKPTFIYKDIQEGEWHLIKKVPNTSVYQLIAVDFSPVSAFVHDVCIRKQFVVPTSEYSPDNIEHNNMTTYSITYKGVEYYTNFGFDIAGIDNVNTQDNIVTFGTVKIELLNDNEFIILSSKNSDLCVGDIYTRYIE